MRYSIIIPIFNAEKTLKRCLDSILNQDFQDFEIIAVNDGSTDSSLEILKNYSTATNKIKVCDKPNGGVSSARNQGIKLAQGDYIVFIDADDWIVDDYLERFSTDESDIIVCGYEAFDRHNIIEIPTLQHLIGNKNVCDYLAKNIKASYLRTPWAKAFRKDTILQLDHYFDENIRFGEDTEFNFRVFAKAQSLSLLPFGGYKYYYGNPLHKWILTPKEYSYAIKSIITAIKNCHSSQTKIAIDDMLGCLMTFFFMGLWAAPYPQSCKISIDYFLKGLYKYSPYKGFEFIKKTSSILLIPHIKLIRNII